MCPVPKIHDRLGIQTDAPTLAPEIPEGVSERHCMPAHFIQNQLKETMIGLTAKSESIDFENGLLMSLYISNFEQLSNKKVKKLIVQNKDNLKKALENTHPEIFDAKHEYKFEIPELEEILDRMPQTSVNTQKATDAISACTQLSFGECSDQASTVHGDSRSRSRFGSVADSERVQPHL